MHSAERPFQKDDGLGSKKKDNIILHCSWEKYIPVYVKLWSKKQSVWHTEHSWSAQFYPNDAVTVLQSMYMEINGGLVLLC